MTLFCTMREIEENRICRVSAPSNPIFSYTRYKWTIYVCLKFAMNGMRVEMTGLNTKHQILEQYKIINQIGVKRAIEVQFGDEGCDVIEMFGQM